MNRYVYYSDTSSRGSVSEGTFWRGDEPLLGRQKELFAKHVPSFGPAKHLEGELERASGMIYHDYYNNGFGVDWSSPHALLSAHVDLLSKYEPKVATSLKLVDKYKRGRIGNAISAKSLEPHLETIARATVKSLDSADKLNKFGPHPGDMWDFGQED